jgi:hypothetical protein
MATVQLSADSRTLIETESDNQLGYATVIGRQSDGYLANPVWCVREAPFKHCVVEGLFTPAVHQNLCSAFDRRMAEAGDSAKRSSSYDASIVSLRESDRAPFFPFLELDFLSRLAAAMELEVSFEVDAAIHRHPPGSRSGWVHTDYNPGWFARAAGSGELVLADMARCNYRSGKVGDESVTPVLRMRHLTLIYYLGNDDWRKGEGGETGLYSDLQQPVERPDIIVPPHSNSMLMFECSPVSLHAFLSTRRVRNSIILWLHCEWGRARAAWPSHRPDYWR